MSRRHGESLRTLYAAEDAALSLEGPNERLREVRSVPPLNAGAAVFTGSGSVQSLS